MSEPLDVEPRRAGSFGAGLLFESAPIVGLSAPIEPAADEGDRNRCQASLDEALSPKLPDIKPRTPVRALDRAAFAGCESSFDARLVLPAVGFSARFAHRVTGKRDEFSADDVIKLLDQDAFCETFVPRSRVLEYLMQRSEADQDASELPNPDGYDLRVGHVLDLLAQIPDQSVNCVVTSTPYWGLRIYEDSHEVPWADGEICAYGHEQTPEAFIRHTVEILVASAQKVAADGSIWWNVMDSFNTRTQIRGNAAEALRAMQGLDHRAWVDHPARRYSAGHAYLKDGEQCMIPAQIAERASRAGLWAKTMITWAKRATLPEPQNSRVSRNLEYVLHLTRQRTPKFSRAPYMTADPRFGGRNNGWESEKLSDVWLLSTSNGGEGHGAQFPPALPGRCIALTTNAGDLVLDPFVGSGTSGVAALHHGCRFIGLDVSQTYVSAAKEKLSKLTASMPAY
ncbi:MAG: site-specific DNA-methyltransferase [Acidimicrobiaceae bacterium]|nr:site-specific DNA-methyltransferase [Acidimicrobiaceae bacterium]